jgi:hypothetical protein
VPQGSRSRDRATETHRPPKRYFGFNDLIADQQPPMRVEGIGNKHLPNTHETVLFPGRFPFSQNGNTRRQVSNHQLPWLIETS